MTELSIELVKEIEKTLKDPDFQFSGLFPLTTAEVFRGLLKRILQEIKEED